MLTRADHQEIERLERMKRELLRLTAIYRGYIQHDPRWHLCRDLDDAVFHADIIIRQLQEEQQDD